MKGADGCVELFCDLGLTVLEAETYVFLLQHSPATGYRVAKGIDRSFPSTYKALASLQTKGAILVDEGNTRLSRAVQPDEFMDQLERRFREKLQRATVAVERLPKSPRDTRIYQLSSVEQVYERSRRMLAECEERALLELFPDPLAALRSPIEETAARGIHVAVRVYEETTLTGVRLVRSPYGTQNLRVFGADWLAMLIDGRQFLLANVLKGRAGVLNAVWSMNPTVSRALYDHANSDFHHYAFRSLLSTSDSIDELRAEYERLRELFPPGGDLGFKDMLDNVRAEETQDGGTGEGQ